VGHHESLWSYSKWQGALPGTYREYPETLIEYPELFPECLP
jgi:hypothetical protein